MGGFLCLFQLHLKMTLLHHQVCKTIDKTPSLLNDSSAVLGRAVKLLLYCFLYFFAIKAK